MDAVELEPRYRELYIKFMAAAQTNPDWFLEQKNLSRQTGKPIEYHPNLGMSEEEWVEFQGLIEKGPGATAIKNGTAEVEFIYRKDVVRFKGSDRLDFLNEIELDLRKNIVYIGDYALDHFETVNVETDGNAFKSKWKGYTWLYEYHSGVEPDDLRKTDDLKAVDLKLYKITVGRLEKNSATYIEVTEKEVEGGNRTKNIQIPFIFGY